MQVRKRAVHGARDQKQKPVVLPSALSVSQPQDAGSLTGLQSVTSGQLQVLVDFCLDVSSTLVHQSASSSQSALAQSSRLSKNPKSTQRNLLTNLLCHPVAARWILSLSPYLFLMHLEGVCNCNAMPCSCAKVFGPAWGGQGTVKVMQYRL